MTAIMKVIRKVRMTAFIWAMKKVIRMDMRRAMSNVKRLLRICEGDKLNANHQPQASDIASTYPQT